MEAIDQFLKWIGKGLDDIGVSFGLVIAGFFGTLLSLEDREGLTMWEKVTVFLSGGAISNYMTPMFVNWFGLNDSIKYGAAFMLGFSGLKGMKLIILYVKKKFFKKD
jgi:hypothetical protein